jgi:hypothetical protein
VFLVDESAFSSGTLTRPLLVENEYTFVAPDPSIARLGAVLTPRKPKGPQCGTRRKLGKEGSGDAAGHTAPEGKEYHPRP